MRSLSSWRSFCGAEASDVQLNYALRYSRTTNTLNCRSVDNSRGVR